MEFENILNAGDYYVTFWVGDKCEIMLDHAKDCLKIVSDTSNMSQVSGRSKGAVIPKCRWVEVPAEGLDR
jgi:hypothetical protein